MEEILNKKWLKIGLFSVLGLVLAAGLFLAGYQFAKIQREKEQTRVEAEQVELTQCRQDSDCVLAIRLDNCCSCPETISRSALNKDRNLVEYEFGKHYPKPSGKECHIICSLCPHLWNIICDSGSCKGVYEEEGEDCYSIYKDKEGFVATYEPGKRECFIKDKSVCPCWDGTRDVCIPQRHCF